jgi:GntR family transcriptional regulator, carbon starvation induced regulator
MAINKNIEGEVRQAIVSGEFLPDSALRLELLRARFDVGFSPIREALSRLASEGLVELVPNKGFRVAPLSRADLEDVAFARSAVERAALTRAIEKGDAKWESQIVAAMHLYRCKAEMAFENEIALQEWEAAHDELHRALISACGSARLLNFQRKLQEQHIRYRRIIVIESVEPQAHIEEHEKLVALVLDRNVDAAQIEMERHLRITVDALIASHFWEEKSVQNLT